MSTADSSHQGPEAPGPATGPSGPAPDPSPSTDHVATFFASIRRAGLVRTPDRWIGGVASGVALRLGVDALLVRAAFGVLALVSGAGLVLYALAWALLPEQTDGRIHLEETIRGRFDSAIAGAGVMLVVGLSWHPGRFGWWGSWGTGWFGDLFGIALLGFVVYLFVTIRRHRDGAASGPSTTGYGTATPGGGPASGAPTAGSTTETAPGTTWARPTTEGYVPYGPAAPTVPASTWPVAPTASATTTPVGQERQRAQSGPGPQDGTGGQGGPVGQGGPTSAPSLVKGAPGVSGGAGGTGGGSTRPPAGPVPGPGPAPMWAPSESTRVAGPGRAVVGLVAGLALLGFAALLLSERTGGFTGDVAVTSLGAVAVLAGLGVVVSGLRGRRSGTLGFFAIMALLAAGPALALQGIGTGIGSGTATFIGDSTFRPTSSEVASQGYSVGLGSTTVDLTAIDLPRGQTVEVPVHVGAGDLTVLVPEDTAVSARVNLGAGRIDWLVDGDTRSAEGVGRSTSFESTAVRDGDDARIHVSIASGAGTITIEEAP